MTKIQLERLKELARQWEKIDPQQVDLDIWQCGTHACLGGWACRMDIFQKQGLRIEGKEPYFTERIEALSTFFGNDVIFYSRSDSENSDISDWELAEIRLELAIAEGEAQLEKSAR